MAWKCTTPRRCISAALPNDSRHGGTSRCAPCRAVEVRRGTSGIPRWRARRRRWRLMAMVVRRHSSPAVQVPHDLARRGRSSPGTAACRAAGRRRSWRAKQTSRTPCGQTVQVAAGVARFRPAVAVAAPGAGVPLDDAGVDRAERRGGEGGEHRRVVRRPVGDAFAADQAGADDLVGVALVELGAGRADRGAAVAARLVDHPVGHVRRCDRSDEQPAGGGFDGGDGPGEPDRAGARGGGFDVGEPGRVVRAGGAGDGLQPEVGGACATRREADGDRLGAGGRTRSSVLRVRRSTSRRSPGRLDGRCR